MIVHVCAKCWNILKRNKFDRAYFGVYTCFVCKKSPEADPNTKLAVHLVYPVDVTDAADLLEHDNELLFV